MIIYKSVLKNVQTKIIYDVKNQFSFLKNVRSVSKLYVVYV